ncbi:MAG: radical SAM protein [Candidatus Muirbacterium halophilum]|nr:radical SAM protein [Candidatus Muirbacterium halophilum]MCK9474663.1 radical SAM protein [Candidatus Muirbacterium halophilum]
MNIPNLDKKVLFVYGGFESYGIEILSNYIKNRGISTELFYFSKLFSDSILEFQTLANYFKKNELKKLTKYIKTNNVLLICFSVVSNDYFWSIDIAKKIKKEFPDIFIIFGGIHPTLVPEEVIRQNCVDFLCEGAGEECIALLCKNLIEKNKDFNNIPNLWFKKNNIVIKPKAYSDFFEKNKNSTPDKELFYNKAPYFSSDLSFQFTRGCFFSCSFCFHSYKNRKFGKKFFYLSPKDSILELKKLINNRKYKNIIFDDDLFVFNKKWIYEFLDLYKKEIKLPFMCVIHIHFIDEKLLYELKVSGCTKIELAIQTINSKARYKVLCRTESNKSIKKSLFILDKSGLDFNIQHMLGIPETNINDEEKAVRFYSNYNVRRIYTFFLTYYPSVDITESSFKQGIISKTRYKEIKKGKVSSYEIDGDINKNILSDYQAIRILFSIIPIMPSFFVKYFSRNKRYRYFSLISPIFRIIDTLNILKNNDRTAKIYIKRYLYTIYKEIIAGLKSC